MKKEGFENLTWDQVGWDQHHIMKDEDSVLFQMGKEKMCPITMQ